MSQTESGKSAPRRLSYRRETQVGGFSWRDSTFLFYSLVNSVLDPEFTVLDYGAGRGAQEENSSAFKRKLLTIKGKVRHVVGVDVDDAVLENQIVDEAHVIRPNEALPFDDSTFDVIFSDWVLEHVDEPHFFASEVYRLLKPGGWFLARTPNRWGAVAIFSSLIPNRLHTTVLSRLQPERKARDVFPTRYTLNTIDAIDRYFPCNHFINCSSYLNTELAYLFTRPLLFRISELLVRLVPMRFYPVLIVAVRKLPE